MNRTEKIERIEKIIESIVEKHEIIDRQKKALALLEEELRNAKTSEIPILLFMIDETLPMPEDSRDYEYEYIYYFPDIDEVKPIVSHLREDFLPNTIDMRKFFSKIGIPSKMWPATSNNYCEQIDYSVSTLRDIIDDLANENEINSWQELGTILKEVPNNYEQPRYHENEEKEQVKILRKTKQL